MGWLAQLLQALAFIQGLVTELAVFNSTPVGQTADLTLPGKPLEVSESGEHWELVSSTWRRVK